MSAEPWPFAVFCQELVDWALLTVIGFGVGCYRVAGWLWRRLPVTRVARALLGTGLVLAVLAGIKGVPLVYGHFALQHEARIAAQQSRMLGEAQVLHNLRMTAFKLGLPEAALEPDAFTFSYVAEDSNVRCVVSYDFVHWVDCFGLTRVPLRFHRKVERTAYDPKPTDALGLVN